MIKWKLWLDDQLDDPHCEEFRRTPPGFVGAKSSQEAIELVEKYGPPSFMDLDHDLGEDDNAMAFLKWLYNNNPDFVPDFDVHSRNPEGKKNIFSFLNSWRRSLD